MKVKDYTFGSITIDDKTYAKDLMIDHGAIKRRNKDVSKKYSESFGHTPLSAEENIPWDCNRLIVGNGYSSRLPVMEEVRNTAIQKGVELVVMPTREAIKHVNDPETNLVLHLTC